MHYCSKFISIPAAAPKMARRSTDSELARTTTEDLEIRHGAA
jgi:hypothetical protein